LALVVTWSAHAPGGDLNDWEQMVLQTRRQYLCCRAAGPVAVDGRLNEAAWSKAPWSEPFVDVRGTFAAPPDLRTRVKLVWDQHYLYLAAELVEPHLWATLRQRDGRVFDEHDFELFLDPDSDSHHYLELQVNALGTVWDLLLDKPYKDGGNPQSTWNVAGLQVAVGLEGTLNQGADVDRGWTVELAVPWVSLGELASGPLPPADGTLWRMNFSRIRWRPEWSGGRYRRPPPGQEKNWVWSPQGIADLHRPEQWGVVQFSAEVEPRALLRPDPTAPARDLLHHLYYAQRDFQARHGRWARNLRALRWGDERPTRLGKSLTLESSAVGYRASVVIELPAGQETWEIRQDARIRPREARP
jgi:hypothetical protein